MGERGGGRERVGEREREGGVWEREGVRRKGERVSEFTIDVIFT